MSNETHIITVRELREMLAPFDEHERVYVTVPDVIVDAECEDGAVEFVHDDLTCSISEVTFRGERRERIEITAHVENSL